MNHRGPPGSEQGEVGNGNVVFFLRFCVCFFDIAKFAFFWFFSPGNFPNFFPGDFYRLGKMPHFDPVFP